MLSSISIALGKQLHRNSDNLDLFLALHRLAESLVQQEQHTPPCAYGNQLCALMTTCWTMQAQQS